MEEARKYIIKLLNESVCVTSEKHPDSIYHIYNKQLIRQKKLERITGDNNNKPTFNYKSVKDDIIFEKDYTNNFFWIDYCILVSLKNKFNIGMNIIKLIFNSIIVDLTIRGSKSYYTRLKNTDKLKIKI